MQLYSRWIRRLPPIPALDRITCDLGLPMHAVCSPGADLQAGSISKAFELLRAAQSEFHSVDEAVYLVEEGLLPAREVVHSLAVTTTQFLFPARTVGTLETGAEATFVALRGDPLSDIANLRDPRWVVKQGTALRAPE